MKIQEFISILQSIPCNSLDKYQKMLICFEATVLTYLHKDSAKKIISVSEMDIEHIYRHSPSLNKNKVTWDEFSYIFSDIIFHIKSSNMDVNKYISNIFQHLCYDYHYKKFSKIDIINIITSNIEQLRPLSQRHHTPNELVELMSKIVNIQDGDIFYDPACGSGEFISAMFNKNVMIYGTESIIERAKISKLKMLATGNNPLNITTPYFNDNNLPEKFDIILSNPPFSLKTPENMQKKICIYGEPPVSNADFIFLQFCIYKLKNNGCAAIIMPDSILFRSGKEQEIRKSFIEKGHISTIIFLPKGIFKNTYVPTSILLLRKQNDYDDILFIDARDKTTFNNDLIIHLFTERENNKLSKIVTKSEIADNDYNLSAALYFKEETEIPEIEQLIDNQKYLSSKLQDLHYDFIHTISRLSPKNE